MQARYQYVSPLKWIQSLGIAPLERREPTLGRAGNCGIINLKNGDFVDVLIRQVIPLVAWIVPSKKSLPNETPANDITVNEIVCVDRSSITDS